VLSAGTYTSESLEISYVPRKRELVKDSISNHSVTPLDKIEVLTRNNMDKDKEIKQLRQLNNEMIGQLENEIAENKKLETNIEKRRRARHKLTAEDQAVWTKITGQFDEKTRLRTQKVAMDKEKAELRQQYEDQRCQLTLLTDNIMVLRRDNTDLHKRLDACEQLLRNSELACQESNRRWKEVEKMLSIPFEDVKLTEKQLARGSFGDSCIGMWQGCLVAVKTFTCAWMKSKDNADIFKKEAAFCSRILHPHVVVIHGILHQEDGLVGLNTELLQGSLEDVIQAAYDSNQYLSLREQVDLSRDCLSGLSFLHRPVSVVGLIDTCAVLISIFILFVYVLFLFCFLSFLLLGSTLYSH
jgi:hypothetical protein